MVEKNIIGKIEYKRKYLKDVVFEKLVQAIYEGKYKQGEKLYEKNLVEELGVSRTPIREAIDRLATADLIEIIPNNGFVICNWTNEDIKNAIKIRAALERLAVEQAINNIEKKDIEYFEKLFKQIDKALEENDHDKNSYYNYKFHWKIISLSKNDYLIKIIKHILDKIYYFGTVFVSEQNRLEKASKEHKEIFKAIKKKDIKLAQELIEKHSKDL